MQGMDSNIDYNACSPTFNQAREYNYMSTPKTNRTLQDSKSPMRKLKLKKSKRRECTPAYSPKFCDEDKSMHHYAYTDKKGKENMFPVDKSISQRLSFDDCPNIVLMQKEPSKKKFLTLIEESLAEVNDNYYPLLSSQVTPDTIFKSIFNEKKSEDVSALIANNLDRDSVFSAMARILNKLKKKNFDVLKEMSTQIIYIAEDFCPYQLGLDEFTQMMIDFQYDPSQASFSNESSGAIFIPGKMSFNSLDYSPVGRFIFDSSPLLRLAVIEIQLFPQRHY